MVIIDTPGVFDASILEALRRATLCLLPVRPFSIDVRATERTVLALSKIGRPYAFVLNQVDVRSPARAEAAARALVPAGRLYPAAIALRTDFAVAVEVGMGITEYGPTSLAANEMRELWRWVKNEMSSVE